MPGPSVLSLLLGVLYSGGGMVRFFSRAISLFAFSSSLRNASISPSLLSTGLGTNKGLGAGAGFGFSGGLGLGGALGLGAGPGPGVGVGGGSSLLSSSDPSIECGSQKCVIT